MDRLGGGCFRPLGGAAAANKPTARSVRRDSTMVLAAVAGRTVGHGVLEAARGALDAHDRDGDARLERGRAEGRVEAVDLLLLAA